MMVAEEDPHANASEKTVEASTVAAEDDDNASKSSTAKEFNHQSVQPTFGKLFGLITAEIPLLIVALVLMVIAEAGNLAVPYVLARAYNALQDYFFSLGANSDIEGTEVLDEELSVSTMSEINLWMGVTLGMYTISQIFSYARGVMLAVIGERLVARLRLRVYKSVLQQEIGFYDENKTGEIVSRLGSDTQLLQTMVSTFAPEALKGILTIVLSIILMYGINAKLTSMTLGGLVVLCMIAVPFGQKLSKLSKDYQNVLGEAQSRSTEALGSIRTVQSFAAEAKELNRYLEKVGNPEAAHDKNAQTTYNVGLRKSITQVGVMMVVFGGAFGWLYCTLWYGFHLVVIEGTLTLGGLSAFQSYVFIIGGGIGSTVSNITQIVIAIGASGRVFWLLERKPKIKNFDGISDDEEELENNDEKDDSKPSVEMPAKERRKSIIPSKPMVGNIEFDNVMFSYPTRPDVLVLNAFSLMLPKDTTTALVGSSGSGKSTVVALIQRFYDVDGGKITLDGVDLTHLDMSWFRSQIGYVQQEPQLFGISIRDNLTYGLSEEDAAKVTQTELENVCRDANAHGFISAWPEGYDTMVGERGVTLSGGQKQRISIARALLTNCRILLLDEATSALDAESEHEVQMAIENAMVGRTVVVVAHRLSTIRSADQIVVMDNRKIVDIGSHDELLEGCKRYQDLIKRQSTMVRDVSNGTLQKMLPPEFTIDEDEE
jgi:ABC-type multidrug transport system fused ATPase/permease subunit